MINWFVNFFFFNIIKIQDLFEIQYRMFQEKFYVEQNMASCNLKYRFIDYYEMKDFVQKSRRSFRNE